MKMFTKALSDPELLYGNITVKIWKMEFRLIQFLGIVLPLTNPSRLTQEEPYMRVLRDDES